MTATGDPLCVSSLRGSGDETWLLAEAHSAATCFVSLDVAVESLIALRLKALSF